MRRGWWKERRDLTPRQIVAELDRHIVGQHDAKRAVAIAIRNRWRRQQLPDDMRQEVAPEEHSHDRPDRRRQDRDRPPAGQAHRRPVHQGRSDQVHRSRLLRPRRREHGPRAGRERHRPGPRDASAAKVEAEAEQPRRRAAARPAGPPPPAYDVGVDSRTRPSATSARARRCGPCSRPASWKTARSRSRSSRRPRR